MTERSAVQSDHIMRRREREEISQTNVTLGGNFHFLF